MKVLVAEDDPKVARFIVRAFQEEGWVTDQVATGSAALEQCALDYDVLVLDWMLPEVDGVAVVRSLRSSGQGIPVILLSARGDVKERILGLEAGADDYLAKPFDLGELLARTRALVRRANADHSTLSVGPLRLDRIGRIATLDGAKIDLTSREFGLLALLAERAGRPVRRTEILGKLWSVSFDPGSNVVDVHVRNVREKLGAHSDMIETVRGVGYRMLSGSSSGSSGGS